MSNPSTIATTLTRALAMISWNDEDGHSLDDEAVDLLHEALRDMRRMGTTIAPPTVNIDELRTWAINEALIRAGGQYRKAAKMLGVSEVMLWRRRDEFKATIDAITAARSAADRLAGLDPDGYWRLYRELGENHAAVAQHLGVTVSRLGRWRDKMGMDREWRKEPLRQGEGTLA